MDEPKAVGAVTAKAPAGVVTGLAELPADAVVDVKALARMLGKCPKSVFRAVERGELPAWMMMGGRATWLVGAVREHLARRQAEAIRAAERHEATRAKDFA